MLEEKYQKIVNGDNLRETLSELRSAVREQAAQEELKQLAGDGRVLLSMLKNEDSKTRKNAALLLGDLAFEEAAEALFSAYQAEQTLFVKSSYLTALQKIGDRKHLDYFKTRLEELKSADVPEEEKKHIGEEIKGIFGIIAAAEGVKKHKFTGFLKPHEILLTTNREQREVTLREIQEISKTVERHTELHPLGVLVFSRELVAFAKLRTYRELLFPLKTDGTLDGRPEEIAEALWKGGLYSFLQECHEEGKTFYFRLELKAEKVDPLFVKKTASALEKLSDWSLFNTTTDYEVEIRLIQTKSGGYLPFLKLFTLPWKRFAYRKNAIAMSIHPATAAMMMQLAKPYLKENAQILDPCCGVGTMLIERDICVPAREKYGIDIFGEAIEMARENASLAGEKINFIHRDFFDFRHDYKFDEIITNMPVKGKKTKEEMDAFYQHFFEKARTLLTEDGHIIMYTNEVAFVKKQLRLQPDFKLLQEFEIRKKDNFHLFVIGMRG